MGGLPAVAVGGQVLPGGLQNTAVWSAWALPQGSVSQGALPPGPGAGGAGWGPQDGPESLISPQVSPGPPHPSHLLSIVGLPGSPPQIGCSQTSHLPRTPHVGPLRHPGHMATHLGVRAGASQGRRLWCGGRTEVGTGVQGDDSEG